jgi:hypothetical protein
MTAQEISKVNTTGTNKIAATYMKSATLAGSQPYYIKYIMLGISASGIGGGLYALIQGWAYIDNQHAEISTIAHLIAVGISAIYGLIVGALIGIPVAVSTAVLRAQTTTILIRRNHPWQFIAPWVCSYGLFLAPALYCFLTLSSTPQTTIIGSRGFLVTGILAAGFTTQILSYIRLQLDDRKTTIGPVHLN